MFQKRTVGVRFCLFLMVVVVFFTGARQPPREEVIPIDRMVSFTVDPSKRDIRLYWKDDSGRFFGSIQRLKEGLDRKHRKLIFAMNGGMFKTDQTPVGLYIEQGRLLAPLDTLRGNGNFYLKPNGVLAITRNRRAIICPTEDIVEKQKATIPMGEIAFATQSGPMLLIKGTVHPAFKEGSVNTNIRNGVGILPDGGLVFALSKDPVNFYDFAMYFKSLGCENALYLDGFVSRAYLPEKQWIQTDGNFGVLIGITEPEK